MIKITLNRMKMNTICSVSNALMLSALLLGTLSAAAASKRSAVEGLLKPGLDFEG